MFPQMIIRLVSALILFATLLTSGLATQNVERDVVTHLNTILPAATAACAAVLDWKANPGNATKLQTAHEEFGVLISAFWNVIEDIENWSGESPTEEGNMVYAAVDLCSPSVITLLRALVDTEHIIATKFSAYLSIVLQDIQSLSRSVGLVTDIMIAATQGDIASEFRALVDALEPVFNDAIDAYQNRGEVVTG